MKRLFLSIGGLVAVLSLAVGLNSALAHLVAAVATGLLGGAVTFLAFNRAICDLTVAHTGLILNLIPVLAAGGAVAALGERLRWPEIVGGLLVVAAATAAATLDERSVVGHRRRRLSRCASVVG